MYVICEDGQILYEAGVPFRVALNLNWDYRPYIIKRAEEYAYLALLVHRLSTQPTCRVKGRIEARKSIDERTR